MRICEWYLIWEHVAQPLCLIRFEHDLHGVRRARFDIDKRAFIDPKPVYVSPAMCLRLAEQLNAWLSTSANILDMSH